MNVETVGSQFASRERFNNDDAARCRNEICVIDGTLPHSTVDGFVLRKLPIARKSTKPCHTH